MRSYISMLANGEVLNEIEAENAFNIIMSGDATPAQIGAFLMALRVRGESISEITGAARALRAKAMFIEAPENAMDIVGTGGDATGTYNISTGAALVLAGTGIPVAKQRRSGGGAGAQTFCGTRWGGGAGPDRACPVAPSSPQGC